MSQTIFDKSRPGRPGFRLPAGAPAGSARLAAAKRRRAPLGLPPLHRFRPVEDVHASVNYPRTNHTRGNKSLRE